jgi:imidazole glycerol-phosphate synthase subunit HisF
MFRPRVIPCLLLHDRGLVKTVKFRAGRYIGDPLNAVKIFNEKQADELIFLDITASRENRTIDVEMVKKIGDQAFMPFTVGGGIRTLQDIKEIIGAGAEKVAINSHAVRHPFFIQKAAEVFGSSTIVVAMDVKLDFFGRYQVFIDDGTKKIPMDPRLHAQNMESMGAGEILVNSMDRDGTMKGYDVQLIRTIADAVQIPVIACGGAGRLSDLSTAVLDGHASALAAGSLFVYHGQLRAVLINFPAQQELVQIFSRQEAHENSH